MGWGGLARIWLSAVTNTLSFLEQFLISADSGASERVTEARGVSEGASRELRVLLQDLRAPPAGAEARRDELAPLEGNSGTPREERMPLEGRYGSAKGSHAIKPPIIM